MIMKSATVGNIKPKMGGGVPSPRKKEVFGSSWKPLLGSPRRSKGPGTGVAGHLNQARSL